MEEWRVVQGEDIAYTRTWRREIASRVWEMMSVCLIDSVWWVAEMGQQGEGLMTMNLQSCVHLDPLHTEPGCCSW